MAEFSYAAVLALIRVIERAGLEDHWEDFLRAYRLPNVDLPLQRPGASYPGPRGPRRLRMLRDLARDMDKGNVKRFFEGLAESVVREFHPTKGRNLVGQTRVFLGLETFSGEGNEATAWADLQTLITRLREGGYEFTEDLRLVAEGAPPPEHEIDKVTGIRIRRALDRDAERIFRECIDQHLPCGAVLIDIDDFGAFNKNHGADIGDSVLSAVAGAVDAACRLRGGVVGRYGGEEIVATMRNLNEDEAAVLGERVRAEIERLSVTEKGLTVTVSVGVASTTKGSLVDLWQAANTAERQAKGQGKNRVVQFSKC